MSLGAVCSVSDLLAGKHAVVTGGARGIGAAATRVLVAHGAPVTVLGRTKNVDLTNSVDLEESCKLDYVSADVSDPDAVDKTFERARDRWGSVSILNQQRRSSDIVP